MQIATSGPAAGSGSGIATPSGTLTTGIRASSATASPPPSRLARSRSSHTPSSGGSAMRAIPQKPLR